MMGKLILISGANGSGKSLFAESLVEKTEGPRYYIATMDPATEENRVRIQKHRKQRAHLGFETLERSFCVGKDNIPAHSVVLLEDVSNLLSNVVFVQHGTMETVFADFCSLLRRCRLLIAVTIGGLEETDYCGETAAYVRALNELNGKLFNLADVAVAMEDGKPVFKKGELQDVF